MLVPLDECTDQVELYESNCGLALIADDKNFFFHQLDVELGAKRHIILTGHKDGKVLVWRSDKFVGCMHDFEEEVTAINKSSEGIVICTCMGQIHVWDVNLRGKLHSISLADLPYKLLNYNITSIDFNQNRVMVLTMCGDVVEISLNYLDKKLQCKAHKQVCVTKIVGQ